MTPAAEAPAGDLREVIEEEVRRLFPASSSRRVAQLDRTAYHEAGHAVAAAVLGHPFEWVTIFPEEIDRVNVRLGHVSGLWSPLPWDASEDAEEDQWYLECGAISFAGCEAEYKFSGKRPRLARAVASSDGTHVDRLLDRLSNPPATDSARRRILREQRDRATALVREHWPAVEVVARLLFAQQNVEYHTVVEVAGVSLPAWLVQQEEELRAVLDAVNREGEG